MDGSEKSAVIEWLQGAISLVQSQKALCAQTGIPVRSLQNWLSGEREPGAYALVKIARETGASLDTIVWPELPGRSAGAPSVLEQVMEQMEEHLDSQGVKAIRPDVYRKLCLIVAKRVQDRIDAAKKEGNVIDINEFADVIDLAINR